MRAFALALAMALLPGAAVAQEEVNPFARFSGSPGAGCSWNFRDYPTEAGRFQLMSSEWEMPSAWVLDTVTGSVMLCTPVRDDSADYRIHCRCNY